MNMLGGLGQTSGLGNLSGLAGANQGGQGQNDQAMMQLLMQMLPSLMQENQGMQGLMAQTQGMVNNTVAMTLGGLPQGAAGMILGNGMGGGMGMPNGMTPMM